MSDAFDTFLSEIERTGRALSNADPLYHLKERLDAGGEHEEYIEDTFDEETIESIQRGRDFTDEDTGVRQFETAQQRFSNLDDFIRGALLGMRVLMTIPTLDANEEYTTMTVKVFGTGTHPVNFRNVLFNYDGGTIDLTAQIPGTGTKRVLLVLNPTLSGNAALSLVTTDSVVADPSQWPIDRIPVAILSLYAGMTGFSFDDIEDVRPLVSWGETQQDEKVWSAVAGTTRYFFDAGVRPKSPYSKFMDFDRNGQLLYYTTDFTVGYDAGTALYYVDITFPVRTGQFLRAKFTRV